MLKLLPVKLTNEELRAKGEEIAAAAIKLNHLEEDKAAEAKAFGEKIKGVRRRMSTLATHISTGEEFRNVACEERPDYEANLMLVWRLDTEEIIERRVLTQEERQKKLVLVPLHPDEPADELVNDPDADDEADEPAEEEKAS